MKFYNLRVQKLHLLIEKAIYSIDKYFINFENLALEMNFFFLNESSKAPKKINIYIYWAYNQSNLTKSLWLCLVMENLSMITTKIK